jgi:growth factor-regulated tyrosine kinase substrate
MLEERLSSTYNQANAMYGLPASTQRPASNLYPSIQSGAPNGTGENYYSGNAASSGAYGQPQSHYGGGYPTPQPPYPHFDKHSSAPPQSYAPPQDQYQQPSQPYPNLAQHQPSASPQLQRQVSNQQYPSSYPPQAPPSNVSDAESANFYYGDNNAAQPPMQRTQSYGSQPSQQQQPPSPQAYSRAPPQQTPLSPPSQPVGAWQNPPYPRQDQAPTWQQQDQNQAPYQQAPQQPQQQQQQQQAPPPQQQQQAPPSQQQFWQQQQQAPQQQQSSAWAPAPYASGGYGPESFPSAPQNQLPVQQQKVVDEPLIDL